MKPSFSAGEFSSNGAGAWDFCADAAFLCGVDEAGRGPLAGPVYAAAVILDPSHPWQGLRDSKTLSAARREALFVEITRHALAWAIARAEVEEIDRLNILEASLLAMERAVRLLPREPGLVLVDGNRFPALPCPTQAVVGGDASVPAISAASILAKVARDRELVRLDRLYPAYGFARHKGYPTAEHLAALRLHGVSPVHRTSFAPVARLLHDSPRA
jgi:ribonuclease HII